MSHAEGLDDYRLLEKLCRGKPITASSSHVSTAFQVLIFATREALPPKAAQNNQVKSSKLQGQIVRLEQRIGQQLHLWRIVCDRGVPIASEDWLAGTRVWAHWIGNAHCGLKGDNGNWFIHCALPTKITRAHNCDIRGRAGLETNILGRSTGHI
jgi:hypothetical protein